MLDFNKLIDNHIAREYKPKSVGRYYPSEIAGCMRKTWFSYKNPKKTDVKLTRIFEAGNMLHEFITEVIKSEKNPEIELIKSELPIQIKEKDFIISGRIDNLVLVKIENKLALVEVKSTKFLPKDHKKEHEIQLQLYMKAMGIDNGIILYIQKDNLETASFQVRKNEKMFDQIIERFHELHKSLTSGEMPEAEAKKDEEKTWMCAYCAWKEECGK
jgi:CRISPR/Cas system-associated exonuclease Cas4 (RecB family)